MAQIDFLTNEKKFCCPFENIRESQITEALHLFSFDAVSKDELGMQEGTLFGMIEDAADIDAIDTDPPSERDKRETGQRSCLTLASS